MVFGRTQESIQQKLGEVYSSIGMIKKIGGSSGLVGSVGGMGAGQGGCGLRVVLRDGGVGVGTVRKLVVDGPWSKDS